MAGHSKWKQIKEKKGKEDAKRSREFGKLARMITIESRTARGNMENPSLKAVIERAKAVNMPKENIERAVARGIGANGGALEQITYEMYGPGGVAILIDTFTDSKNRTNQELKHLVDTLGYTLASPGAASWAFTKDTEGSWISTTTVPLNPEDTASLETLIAALEAYSDVEAITTNAEG